MPVLAGTLLSVASFLAFGALLVLYGANSSEMIAALSLDYADLGFLGSMLSLGLGVGIVLAGPLTDRLPRRPLYIAACLAVLASATTLNAQTDYRALLVHTLIIGFGAGFYETVLNALIVEDFGDRAPRRLLFVHAGATAAASVTPLVFEAIRAQTSLAWHDAFRSVGWLHALLILGALAVPMRAPTRAPNNQDATTIPRSGNDRIALAAVCAATFAYVGAESAISLFVVDHTATNLGFDPSRAARTIAAFWGGLLVGRLAVGFSPHPIGAGTTAALAAFAALLMFSFGIGWISSPELAMSGVGFFLGGVFPIMIGLAGLALPTAPGTAVGLAGGLGSLGGFFIPWVTGRLANDSSLSVALASLGGWLLILVTAGVVVRHRFARTQRVSR